MKWEKGHQPSAETVERLARQFGSVLSGWLTQEEKAEVIRLNKDLALYLCATDDLCDANDAMAIAWRLAGLPHLLLPSEAEATDGSDWILDLQGDLWSAAWRLARMNQFWFMGCDAKEERR